MYFHFYLHICIPLVLKRISTYFCDSTEIKKKSEVQKKNVTNKFKNCGQQSDLWNYIKQIVRTSLHAHKRFEGIALLKITKMYTQFIIAHIVD